MSIFKTISTLTHFLEKIASIKEEANPSSEQAWNDLKNIERQIVTIESQKFENIASKKSESEGDFKQGNKENAPFPFLSRLSEIAKKAQMGSPKKEQPHLESPQKPITKRTFSTPTKRANLFSTTGEDALQILIDHELEQNLKEARSTETYLARLTALEDKINAMLEKLKDEVQENKEKSKKELMEQFEQEAGHEVLDDLYEVFHADEGIFEKVATDLAKARIRSPLKPRSIHREDIFSKRGELFAPLGNVDVEPKNYFKSTPETDSLARVFMEKLYASPERVEALLSFQRVKEKGLKINFLKSILAISASSLYNISVLYRIVPDTQQREYITSVSEEDDLDGVQLESIEEMNKKAVAYLCKNALTQNVEEIKAQTQIIQRKFQALTTAKTCISFFPIRIEYKEHSIPEYICLVTTSGEVKKLDKENIVNRQALINFQEMLQEFIETHFQQETINGIVYTFRYHAQEKPYIDLALDQINKGLSGEEQPLSGAKQEHAAMLVKPLRPCAEKKFIAYVRNLLISNNNITSLQVLGAANIGMPHIVDEIAQVKKIGNKTDSSVETHHKLMVDLYTQLIELNEKNSISAMDQMQKTYEDIESSSPLHPVKVNLQNITVEKTRNRLHAELAEFLKKYGQALNAAHKKQKTAFPKEFIVKVERQRKLSQDTINPKSKPSLPDTFSIMAASVQPTQKEGVVLSAKFIPCCDGCQAAKLPVLTLLSHYLPAYHQMPKASGVRKQLMPPLDPMPSLTI